MGQFFYNFVNFLYIFFVRIYTNLIVLRVEPAVMAEGTVLMTKA